MLVSLAPAASAMQARSILTRARPDLPPPVAPQPAGPFCSREEKAAFARDLRRLREEAQTASDTAAAHHRRLLADAERRRHEPLSGAALEREAADYAEVRRAYAGVVDALAVQAVELKSAPVVRCQVVTGPDRCGGRAAPPARVASAAVSQTCGRPVSGP